MCNQTGKFLNVKAYQLSFEDGQELTDKSIKTGTQVLVDENGKSYAATIMPLQPGRKRAQDGNTKGHTKKKQRIVFTDSEEEMVRT